MFCRACIGLLLPLFLIMTSPGCQSTGAPRSGTSATGPTSAPAQDARAPIPDRTASRDVTPILDEAEIHLASGDPYLAHVALREEDLQGVDAASTARAAALRVESSIALGLLEEAEAWLQTAELQPVETARLRAQICQKKIDHRCVFEQLCLVASLSEAPLEFNDRIWAALTAAAGASMTPEAAADTHTEGWSALLDVVRPPASLQEERRAFASWKQAWPDHPAARALPEALRYLEQPDPPRMTAAVLLPLSGPLQPIGRAVRDGMMSAHVFEADPGDQPAMLPTLRFIDSAAATIEELHAEAITIGANVIIGPVLREGVAALASLAPRVPVIALNYLEGRTAPAGFFQLGITIEDEARGIRERLEWSGYQKVLFVVSTASWAERALKEILAGWDHEPILMRVRDSRELTGLVGGALGSTPEFLRKSSIQTLTGLPVVFDAGKRHDLDAIVALTDPVQSSTLGPALSYHSVGRIDTYLGTQSFRSESDVAGLAAILSDLPVMTGSDRFNVALRRAWLGQSAADISFHALGADAYRLLRRLPGPQSGDTRTLWGSSGILILGKDGSIRRQQTLAKFSKGKLVPIAAIP